MFLIQLVTEKQTNYKQTKMGIKSKYFRYKKALYQVGKKTKRRIFSEYTLNKRI